MGTWVLLPLSEERGGGGETWSPDCWSVDLMNDEEWVGWLGSVVGVEVEVEVGVSVFGLGRGWVWSVKGARKCINLGARR